MKKLLSALVAAPLLGAASPITPLGQWGFWAVTESDDTAGQHYCAMQTVSADLFVGFKIYPAGELRLIIANGGWNIPSGSEVSVVLLFDNRLGFLFSGTRTDISGQGANLVPAPNTDAGQFFNALRYGQRLTVHFNTGHVPDREFSLDGSGAAFLKWRECFQREAYAAQPSQPQPYAVQPAPQPYTPQQPATTNPYRM